MTVVVVALPLQGLGAIRRIRRETRQLQYVCNCRQIKAFNFGTVTGTCQDKRQDTGRAGKVSVTYRAPDSLFSDPDTLTALT